MTASSPRSGDIHPFEDGNGRIGRAIGEKALAPGLSNAVLTAVAGTLLKHRKQYYEALEAASRDLADLAALEVLRRTGERKATRYHLSVPLKPVATVTIEEIQ